MNAEAVARLVGGRVEGDPAAGITGVSDISNAKDGDLTFVQTGKHAAAAAASRASVVLTSEGIEVPGKTRVIVRNPKYAFIKALTVLKPPGKRLEGVDAHAAVHPSAELGAGAYVGPFACVEEGAKIGAGSSVLSGARIGGGSRIGTGSVVHRNAVLYPGTILGNGVIVHAGAVLGSDGFGYVQEGREGSAGPPDAIERYMQFDEPHLKVPHFGRVEVGDEVEIGANTTIDRATTGATVIGLGSKIDNLVQIGHNCRIGAHAIIVSMVGIGGSVRIGMHVTIGGNSGISEGVEIGDFCIIGAHTLVYPGKKFGMRTVVWGNPARQAEKSMAQLAALSGLPGTLRKMRGIEGRISDIEGRIRELEAGREP